ncbi:MAG TPA: hypothetical protein VJ917_11560 [Saprospiraceae bacterium]|nr:hypothetical protein [Saprospiraceae bacterium]
MKFLLLSSVMLLLIACQDDNSERIHPAEFLINEKGWVCYAYKRSPEGDTTAFIEQKPYILLGEYGNGIHFEDNSQCYIQYTDGTTAVPQNGILKTWERISMDSLRFHSLHSDTIEAEIVEITEDSLYLRYHQVGDIWRYKLRRIP